MSSMNWLGFSLAPHDEDHNSHSQMVAPMAFNTDGSTDISHSFPIFEGLNTHNTHHTSQDWNTKSLGNNSSEENYCNNNISKNLLLETSCNQQQHPKLENFLGQHSFGDNNHPTYGGGTNTTASSSDLMFRNCSLQLPLTGGGDGGDGGGSPRNNTSIGLSMIKSWLRNQPQQSDSTNMNSNVSQSSSSVALSLLSENVDNGESSSLENNKHNPKSSSAVVDNQGNDGATVESVVPRKSSDTFGQRTSIYRGVTRHRWTGRYEAHLWDNSCRREGQTRKGRQVYLGGYDKEEKAARAYDLAALKYWGATTTTNFPTSTYEKELEEMKHMTRQEYVASLRRKSSGFSRGASIYRGVTRHHQHGRWQARIGRVAGNKDLYLGTFGTQEEAAEAYDIAAIKFRGLNAVTNFDMTRYDVKSILESTTLPIGSAAKRNLKENNNLNLTVTTTLDHNNISSSSSLQNNSITSHLGYGPTTTLYHGWNSSLAFQQPHHPYSQIQNNYSPYGHNSHKLWCKQEQDSEDHASHQTFHDIHSQLQLGNNNSTHNFFHSDSRLNGLMSIGSSSMDNNSSSSSSVIYDGNGYGNGGGYMIPMATPTYNIGVDGNQSQRISNVYGRENEMKVLGFENNYSTSDPYHARNLYYQQPSADACNTWVPTPSSTLAPRTNNLALSQGSQPFTLLHE